MHALKHIIDLGIADQAQYCGIYAVAVWVVGLVVITVDSVEGLWRFAGC